MAITSFTIGGVEVDPLLEGFEIRETEGGVSTLVCDIESIGTPAFSVHDPIAVEEDGTKIFAGTLSQTRSRGRGGPNLYDAATGDPELVTSITAEDYTRLAERAFVTATVVAGTTRKAFLTTLVADYLSVFGVTLHASQADGPALPALDYVRARLSDVLQAIAGEDLWRIDYDKQLRMWAPGDLAAPFDIDEDDLPAKWTGDVEVENILGDEYANQVTVVVGPLVEENRPETFVGDGVTDTFALTYQLTGLPYGVIHVFESDGVTPAGGETIGFPPDSPLQWEIDTSVTPHTITRTAGVTAADKVYKLTFHGVLHLEGFAEDAADVLDKGPYPHTEQRDDILTQAAADDLAADILALRLQAGDQVGTYETRQTAPTLRAGQQQALTSPARGLSGNYIITDLSVMAEEETGLLIRKVTAKKNRLNKYQHTYRDWLLGKGGGSVSINTGSNTPSSSGPAPPLTSVQFNRSGAFGGDEAFTYDEATTSLIVGEGSTITAADVSHGFIFGPNNHIVDP